VILKLVQPAVTALCVKVAARLLSQTATCYFSVGSPIRQDLFSWKKDEISACSLKPELHTQLYVTLTICKCLKSSTIPSIKAEGTASTDSGKKRCGSLFQKPWRKARWT